MKQTYFFLLALLLIVPTTTFAQNFLVGIPGVEQGSDGSFDRYIQAVYVMFISIAALLAVVKIIIAGLKYMFTDIVTQKGEAKKDIQGAVFGLLIVLSAVLILTVINPELTRFEVDQERVNLPAPLPEPRPVTQMNTTDGYAFIPSDSSSEYILEFITNCDGRPQRIGDEVRCYELDQDIEDQITDDLSNGTNQLNDAEIQEALEQAQNFLNGRFIADTSAIQTDLEVAEVFFAIDVAPSESIIEIQAAGVCEVYANAYGETWGGNVSSYGAGSNVQLVSSGSPDNYAACVRID